MTDAAERTAPLFVEPEHQPAPRRPRRPSTRKERQAVIDAAQGWLAACSRGGLCEALDELEAALHRLNDRMKETGR